MKTLLRLLLVSAAILLAWLSAAGTTTLARGSAPQDIAPAAPSAPLDVPDTLVPGGVSDYTIAAPKLFWHSGPAPCPPHLPSGISAPQAPSDNFTDSISRIAVQGSLTRTVYFQQLVCDGLAGKIESNIVADANYIYFTKSDALYRLSVNANPGDAPELMNALVSGYAELAVDNDFVYTLTFNGNNTGNVDEIRKDNKAYVHLYTTGTYPSSLQVSYAYFFGAEDSFLYWLQGGTIYRYNKNGGAVTPINPGTAVSAYFAEGGRYYTCGNFCFGVSDQIYVSTGQIVRTYNNWSSAFVGTSFDAGANNAIYAFASDDDTLFMLERYTGTVCSPFCPITDYVLRHPRSLSGGADILYVSSTDIGDVAQHIAVASDYVFWQDSGRVLRLPKTAGALPTTNMQITGLEITQGIQKPDNSVRLIQNKRTFVRLFVKSDGPAVPGVTALLDGACGGSPLESLLPVNDVGTNISVPSSPKRSNLNDSFLFELPWGWTTCGTLNLSGHLNPFHAPPESGYGDNDWSAGPFTFSASPRLQVQFVAWQYVLFNQFHTPLFIRDIMETFSWIRRAYPLNSTPGFSTDSSVGFRPGLWFVGDDSLGNMVRGSAQSCQDLYYKDKDGKQHDDRNLCASRYTNQQMAAMRSENGMPDSLFFYGMLADTKDPGNNWVFPRGQACCGKAVSSGPVGADGSSGYFWYNGDGTYGDWYAAHEIGHTLGRNHPVTKGPDAANRKCGQSEDDSGYPYNYAQIGVDDNTEGFDAGDASLKQPKRVYPGTQWADVMSYCAEQWLSDYTYEAMYQYMTSAAAQASQSPDAVALSGDWLSVQGTIISGTNTASINRARHLTSVASLPPLVPGGYAIRLLNAGNGQLANYLFSGDPLDGQPDLLMFSQVVTFTAGARKVQIVRTADNSVLTSLIVPSQPPTISNVALQGAPNPVTGTVTLAWTASDPGGLPLSFDVYYILTGSPTPQPVKLNVIGTSTQLDTTKLGGGTGRLRVVANDGFDRAQADSAAFTMASKPPLTIIDTPGSGLRVHYGQVVNFSGEALDYQDGSVSGSGLQWRYQKGVLGTGSGALQSLSNLPVGTNAITLTATNSKGLFASSSITVVVDDNLSLLDSTLTAGPTQFGWTFPAGATHVQTSTLHIDNAGAGTLNWNATSDASWLTLGASSGTAPSSLVVTANPNGIPANTGLSGHISLSASGQPTITIPAGIVVGNLQDLPIAAKLSFIYLPLLER